MRRSTDTEKFWSVIHRQVHENSDQNYPKIVDTKLTTSIVWTFDTEIWPRTPIIFIRRTNWMFLLISKTYFRVPSIYFHNHRKFIWTVIWNHTCENGTRLFYIPFDWCSIEIRSIVVVNSDPIHLQASTVAGSWNCSTVAGAWNCSLIHASHTTKSSKY
jgi:hypothetical protein